jgi:hypothetical protein
MELNELRDVPPPYLNPGSGGGGNSLQLSTRFSRLEKSEVQMKMRLERVNPRSPPVMYDLSFAGMRNRLRSSRMVFSNSCAPSTKMIHEAALLGPTWIVFVKSVADLRGTWFV